MLLYCAMYWMDQRLKHLGGRVFIFLRKRFQIFLSSSILPPSLKTVCSLLELRKNPKKTKPFFFLFWTKQFLQYYGTCSFLKEQFLIIKKISCTKRAVSMGYKPCLAVESILVILILSLAQSREHITRGLSADGGWGGGGRGGVSRRGQLSFFLLRQDTSEELTAIRT